MKQHTEKLGKLSLPLDKRSWSPSFIPGPIVLVTTRGTGGDNLAPKSWFQMVAFEPPTLMFSGTEIGLTESNVLASSAFGVNVVTRSMLAATRACLQWHGAERVQRSELTLEEASLLDVPLVQESPIQLECTLSEVLPIGSGLVVFGRIVAAWMDPELAVDSATERYRQLDQALFLESGVYGSVQPLEW